MPRGRPREFDPDKALDKALKVFWKKGYEGASLPDLTAAMGINRPSLYAAFGNKEALFRRAMERYASGPASYVRAALAAPTAREVFEAILVGAVGTVAGPGKPRGCLAVQGALACGDEAEPVRKHLGAMREKVVTLLRERFERAKSDGDLPTGADPAVLARYAATVMHGLAVQAAGGASADELRQVTQVALAAWPE